MIITKTPFRISFAGGGTDQKEFYETEPGIVISTTIDKYMYLTVNRYFENQIILKYANTELVDRPEDIKHPIIRECFGKTNTGINTEVTSLSDIPSVGTGLGSSSAFTVGLLKALYGFKSINKSNMLLAKEACEIEIDNLREPIGKQDQYACAVGGFNVITFNPDETVMIDPINIKRSVNKELNDNLIMFYTGINRKASLILKEQKEETKKPDKMNMLRGMKRLVYELRDSLRENDLSKFGDILHKGWILKKSMATKISNSDIDNYYDKAIGLGAHGGKILGAGGGGFLLFYCEKEKQDKVIQNLGLRHVKFSFDPQGSRIIYLEEKHNE